MRWVPLTYESREVFLVDSVFRARRLQRTCDLLDLTQKDMRLVEWLDWYVRRRTCFIVIIRIYYYEFNVSFAFISLNAIQKALT